MKEENINLLEYQYTNGAEVTIPGDLVYGLMQVLNQVKESETHYVFNHYYDANPKEVKGLNGAVSAVKTEKVKYPSAESYFNQEPQIATTMLGNASLDLLMVLQGVHSAEIEKGNAVKVGSVVAPKKEKVDVKLS